MQQLVGFADQLHVAVLDPVVHHFHVVPGATRADPLAAGDVVVGTDFGRDGLEHFLDLGPGARRPAGHQAGALQGAFFPARHPATAIQQTGVFDGLGPAFGVDVIGVSAVDDDVAGLTQRDQGFDDRVDRGAGLNQQHQLARPFDGLDEILDRVGADKVLACGASFDQLVDFGGCAVVHGHLITAALDVLGQVLAHHGQSNQTKITVAAHCFFQVKIGAVTKIRDSPGFAGCWSGF